MRGKNEIRRVGIVGTLDVARRRLIVTIRMRMINSEEFKRSTANLTHHAEQLFGRNFVGGRRMLRHILRRESLCDRAVSPREQSAALLNRIASRVIQDLNNNVSRKPNFVHRAAVTLDDFSLQTAGLALYSRSA